MGPGDLSRALSPLPVSADPRLLVGRETGDDAGVFRIDDDFALVQTVDFFAPIVDDPYTFGQVAAANALSDIYAMGAEPLTALNIVAFPSDELPLEVLTSVLRGGHDLVHQAGAVVVGGHTVIDDELKYGLAVTGRVHPSRMLTNAGARPGDRLVLTKPLGSGLVATALKARKLKGEGARAAEERMIEVMTLLNRDASRVAVALGARAATDVTGFGFLGHASHIARESGVTLHVSVRAIAVLPGAQEAHQRRVRTAGEARNLEYVEADVAWGTASAFERALLTDPQTSGGLLLALPERSVAEYVSQVAGAVEIGTVGEASAHRIALS